MIQIERVAYAYPGAARPALRDLTLEIAAGEFLLVCGPSGAGKSTFLRLLNGLTPHFYGGRLAGRVRVWGRDTSAHQPRDLADLVGFVFQDPEAQFVVDVVEDEIVFAMENLGLAPRMMRRRVEEVLDQLGIAALRRRQISSLSGGERQRVAIAAVLAAQPRALVLDEPTSQLDPHAAEEVLTVLQKLNADLGLTVVLSEHRLERVVQYADRVLYLPAHNERQPQNDRDEKSAGAATSAALDDQPPFLLGRPREIMAQVDLTPPLVALGKALGWAPLPLTIKEGRIHAAAERAPLPSPSPAPAAPDASAAPSLIVGNLHYSYGEHEAIYNLSLSARPGEILALMGRNGSGKTTLLKLIVGLLKPQRGALTVLGRDAVRTPVEEMAQFVGYVPQDPRTLLFHDTLRDELAFTLAQRGERAARAEERIRTTLERFGLAQLAEIYPRQLSGGEAQRAALAAILVADPPIVLLDEPTRGLDYAAKDRLGLLLRGLANERRTIILATHDVELVAAYADRVALLGDGELVAEGPAREMLGDSLIFSSQVAKLFPGSGWLTVADAVRALQIAQREG